MPLRIALGYSCIRAYCSPSVRVLPRYKLNFGDLKRMKNHAGWGFTRISMKIFCRFFKRTIYSSDNNNIVASVFFFAGNGVAK